MENLGSHGRCNKANQRQHSRHKARYEWYHRMKKRELGHIRRIEKHIKRYKDNSPKTQEALARYQILLKE